MDNNIGYDNSSLSGSQTRAMKYIQFLSNLIQASQFFKFKNRPARFYDIRNAIGHFDSLLIITHEHPPTRKYKQTPLSTQIPRQ